MPEKIPQETLVVSYTEMAKALPGVEEALAAPPEGAPRLTPREKIDFIFRLHDAMEELRALPDRPGVLVTPRDQFASLLQSAFAEAAADKGRVQKAPGVSALEAKFDKTDVGWASVAWAWLKRAVRGRIGYARPQKTGALPSPFRTAIFGDWGTGLYGAPVIGQSIAADPEPVDLALHLGDTYYSGTGGEFAKRFDPQWPERPGALHRALNANHEMYSGGRAYRDTVRRKFGQKSSVFSLANDDWLLIGMDTALEDHSLNDEQAAWVEALVDGAGGRRVVLFSHHQPFSRLDKQGPKLIEKLRPVLEGRKIFAWYWGHEHHCVLYERHPKWGFWGRCIGHGGIPEFRHELLGRAPKKPGWKKFPAAGLIPECRVLNAANEFLGKLANEYSPHGYATLIFDGGKLTEEIRDAHGELLRTTELD